MRPVNIVFCALLFALLAAANTVYARGYTSVGNCEGFARVDIRSPSGTCVALVADERQGLRMPRRILEIAPNKFWIIDMGSWEKNQGRLYEMQVSGTQVSMKTLLSQLDRPLGLAKGKDGQIYIGEASKIWRTSTTNVQKEIVLDNLASDGTHPLKEITFDANGSMYFNLGSASDICRNEAQKLPMPCPEVQGTKPRAAVYKVDFDTASKVKSVNVFATGLRNSLALLALNNAGKNIVLQGENSVDYADVNAPSEEFNILVQGRNYGWPYCLGNAVSSRGYENRFDCRKTTKPTHLWPAHVAPLYMMQAPANSPYAKKLLVSWHGYRAKGHSVMAFPLNANHTLGAGMPLLSGWEASGNLRPRGTPTGLTIDSQGRLWIVEDLNRTVLMLSKPKP